MKLAARGLVITIGLMGFGMMPAQSLNEPTKWRLIIANDNCPDVTWGLTYEQTRQALAELVGAHLDEMKRTDAEAPENRDHYTMATTFEVECFLERHPERQPELVQRLREGRLCLSPFLCNSLWGFQSTEGAIRSLYPARRLERAWRIPIDIAEHIELPSLPWGMASLLAGCGVRWVSVPFLDYDSTFSQLNNPPLFRWEGPDGGQVRVILDSWASLKANYAQGGYLLKDPRRIAAEWLPHYQPLGSIYPLRTLFASGTHSDIQPNSAKQVRGYADGIRQYNAASTNPVTLVNGTLAQFCRQADAWERASPFLPTLRGCGGHSWELWPISLARTAADLRQYERDFLAAESLIALANQVSPGLGARTQRERERAEWFWAMLADHAWNGTDPTNQQHNAALRQTWAAHFGQISQSLTRQAWQQLGLRETEDAVTVFNALSFENDVLIVCDVPPDKCGVRGNGREIVAQTMEEAGRKQIAFVARKVPAFGFLEYRFHSQPGNPNAAPVSPRTKPSLRATPTELASPFYRLQLDPKTGGFCRLVHQPTGQELLRPSSPRSLAQTVFFDGQEYPMTNVQSSVMALGPVLARLRVTGSLGPLRVTNRVTLYAELDCVDFDLHLAKPATTNEQRLLHFFPINDGATNLHVETTGAVIRPRPQPDGDLLPGADPRRFAVQDFVDFSPSSGLGITIVPWDAFMLRLDQGTLAFEALGNDQNGKEVIRNQNGHTQFHFRYRLFAHEPGFHSAIVQARSRSTRTPLTIARGRLPGDLLDHAHLSLDPTRALALCLKPAEEDPSRQIVVRLWEISGHPGTVQLRIPGFRKAHEVDLLERDRGVLPLKNDRLSVPLRGHGFSAVKLMK